MIAKINLVLAVVLMAVLVAMGTGNWNPFAPKDYEECAEQAAREAKSKDALSVLINSCDSKFAGRRKLGGGYTYYDSRQFHSFDLSGPNPTNSELEYINNAYEAYLDDQRRSALLTAEMRDSAARSRQAAVAETERQQRLAFAMREQRKGNALQAFQVLSHNLECRFGSCGLYRLSVTVKNASNESTSAISLGLVFLPAGEEKCPTSLPSKTRQAIVMRPGDTTVLNYEGYDGPPVQTRYCVRVTDIELR